MVAAACLVTPPLSIWWLSPTGVEWNATDVALATIRSELEKSEQPGLSGKIDPMVTSMRRGEVVIQVPCQAGDAKEVSQAIDRASPLLPTTTHMKVAVKVLPPPFWEKQAKDQTE